MVIYVIYKEGQVISVTTLPRIVIDEFKWGADRVGLWRNEKLLRTFTSPREFNKFINPQPSEDDDTGGQEYEW